jgi:Family of unknown function (DUF5709)
MSDPGKHESQDLGDYEVLDGSDTLDGKPGDDPLDRGVATPDHWSAGLKYALRGDENSESLDELLAEEEPDVADEPEADDWDENATEAEVARRSRFYDQDPRAGRLVAPDEDTDDIGETLLDWEDEAVARDTGIDGGAASAEEAAVHVIEDEDDDEDEDDEDEDDE